MENKSKITWWRYVLSVPVYVVLCFVGGSVVLILNAFMPKYGRFYEGDVGYYILQVISGPVGVVLANVATLKILGRRSMLPVVLNIIMATVFIGVPVFIILTSRTFSKGMVTVLLAGAAAVCMAVLDLREYNSGGKDGNNS